MKIKQTNAKYDAVHERLTNVLDIVRVKRPLLEYEAERSIMGHDGKRLLVCVSVWQHGQQLGSIEAYKQRYSHTKNENIIWFGVSSPLIQKQRGREDTKYCKNAESAAKIVIDVFAKRPLAVLGEKIGDQMCSLIEGLANRCSSMFGDYFRNNTLAYAKYFMETHLGNTPPIPPAVKQCINDQTMKAYDNYKIAKNVKTHLSNKNGHTISYMQDGSFLVVDMADYSKTHKYSSTYEMPQFMQEKFAMLKLLEPNQFAENIGVKVLRTNSSDEETLWYFIVNGETVVN